MSTQGNLTFYTKNLSKNWKQTIKELMALLNAESAYSASKSIGESQEWNGFQNDSAGEKYEHIKGPLSTEEVLLIDKSANERLGLGIKATDFGAKFWEIMKSKIPDEIRGDFAPNGVYVQVGPHDIFETVECADGHYFGRADFSFSLTDYNSPNDWVEYRNLVFQLSEIIELKASLEKIVGPVENCIYWT